MFLIHTPVLQLANKDYGRESPAGFFGLTLKKYTYIQPPKVLRIGQLPTPDMYINYARAYKSTHVVISNAPPLLSLPLHCDLEGYKKVIKVIRIVEKHWVLYICIFTLSKRAFARIS